MFSIFRPTIIENTIQGINETKENINPIVPAVDGISIKIPAINPQIAANFPNSFDLNITFANSKRAIVAYIQLSRFGNTVCLMPTFQIQWMKHNKP